MATGYGSGAVFGYAGTDKVCLMPGSVCAENHRIAAVVAETGLDTLVGDGILGLEHVLAHAVAVSIVALLVSVAGLGVCWVRAGAGEAIDYSAVGGQTVSERSGVVCVALGQTVIAPRGF